MKKTSQHQSILRIGMDWPEQGGVLAGMMKGENGQPDYFLIVPTDPAAYNSAIAWGGQREDEPGAASEIDGATNTRALVESKIEHPAAKWADGLRIDGHFDFYLPARRELRLLWCTVPHLFQEGWYWSSTQCSPGSAWGQNFASGSQGYNDKDDQGRARAVRRFLIQ
jgi:hypothetical protein